MKRYLFEVNRLTRLATGYHRVRNPVVLVVVDLDTPQVAALARLDLAVAVLPDVLADDLVLVPRQELAAVQSAGDVLGAHHMLTEAYRTDVRPLLARAREEMGVPADPIAAYLSSGYEEKIAAERGTADTGGGYQS